MEPDPPWTLFALVAVAAVITTAMRFRSWRTRRRQKRRSDRPRFGMNKMRLPSTVLSLASAVAAAWWAADRWALSIPAAWFVGINVAAIVWFFVDKLASIISVRRVPEPTLHTVAALGGSPGAVVGRDLFKRKTVTASFNTTLSRVIFVQILLVLLYLYIRSGSP